MTDKGGKPLSLTHIANSAGICVMAKPALSMSAPSNTRKIIAVACAVPVRLLIIPAPRNPPVSTANMPQAYFATMDLHMGFVTDPDGFNATIREFVGTS